MGGRRQHSFAALAPPADLTIVTRLLPPATPWLMHMPASSVPCSDGSCRRAGKMELAPIVKLRLVTLLINRHKSDRIRV